MKIHPLRFLRRLTLCGLALWLLAAKAGAATIEFNFADGLGNRNAGELVTYADGGVDLAVTARFLPFGRDVHINGDTGLGVVGNTAALEGNRIGRGESLTFTFDRPVALERIIAFDEIAVTTPLFFVVLVDGAFSGAFGLTRDESNFVSLDATGLASGSAFRFIGLGRSEGFRVTALRATVIPLPGGIVLLGGALLALGVARRR